MKYTKNYQFKKTDACDIQNKNDNMDILDVAFNMGDIVKVDIERIIRIYEKIRYICFFAMLIMEIINNLDLKMAILYKCLILKLPKVD